MSETLAEGKAAPVKKAAVFMGDNFIELDDPSAVTLEDLCESFGTPWESGMHVRQRSTGRVVATLPFEPLPPLTEVRDIRIKTEDPAVSVSASATLDAAGAEEDDEDGTDGDAAYAAVYDLVNSNTPEVDEATATLAGPLAANIRDIPGIEETMRQLVELGAAELLTAEPASVVHNKREYNPTEAPGLLRRIVYPSSQYSPYRTERDPVSDGRHALFRTTAATSSPTSSVAAPFKVAFVGEGGPYTSYLDSYALGAHVDQSCLPAADMRKTSLLFPLTNEEQQKIFGV